MYDEIDPEEVRRILEKNFGDLTVLEFQTLMVALEDSKYQAMGSRPETIDLANRLVDLTVKQFVTAVTHSLPRGIPRD